MNSVLKVERAEAYCKHISNLNSKIKLLELDIEDTREHLTGVCGVSYTDMPGNPNAYADGIPDGIARLQEMIESYLTLLSEYLDEQQRFSKALQKLTIGEHSLLIYLRYSKRYRWNDIARMLHYSQDHVRGLMKNLALLELYEHIPGEWKHNTKQHIHS